MFPPKPFSFPQYHRSLSRSIRLTVIQSRRPPGWQRGRPAGLPRYPLRAMREAGGRYGLSVVAEPPTQLRGTDIARTASAGPYPRAGSPRSEAGYNWIEARAPARPG